MTAMIDKHPEKIVVVPGGCHVWIAANDGRGYGKVWHLGGMARAHRVAYEVEHGPIPVGLQIDHLCRVRGCVNPDHLEPVAPRENTLRGSGPAAKRARQTHCLRGHPLAGRNLRGGSKPGQRQCKRCHTEQARARRRGSDDQA